MNRMKRILVTGAIGQIGSELTLELRRRYGAENVIATDLRSAAPEKIATSGPFESLNVLDKDAIKAMLKRYDIDSVFHLAAILSGVGEKDPALCWNVNINGSLNILNLGVEMGLNRIIIPSSMAVWGEGIPKENVPQDSVLKPTSMYGATKVAGERLCDYYVHKYKLDCRGLRYPGIISNETLPGGGTTDYAVEIFYEAVKRHKYSCFLTENTKLPMMYMPDCIKATIDLAEADFANLKHHSDFNVAAMSFTPRELSEAIRKYMPDFEISYAPDFRQAIADSWPWSIDDSAARAEWGWAPSFDLEAMTRDMLEKLTEKHNLGLI